MWRLNVDIGFVSWIMKRTMPSVFTLVVDNGSASDSHGLNGNLRRSGNQGRVVSDRGTMIKKINAFLIFLTLISLPVRITAPTKFTTIDSSRGEPDRQQFAF
jgi:hypothetical protein